MNRTDSAPTLQVNSVGSAFAELNPPMSAQAVPVVVPLPGAIPPFKKSRRRRGSGKNQAPNRAINRAIVNGLIAGVEYSTPSTRLIAIFLNGLTKAEKVYALDLLLRMAKGPQQQSTTEGGAAC